MKNLFCPRVGQTCREENCAKFASCTQEEIAALYSLHLDKEAKQLTDEASKVIRGENDKEN